MKSSPKADKTFGQHFLINTGVVQKIVDSVARHAGAPNAHIVEIGPGPGALTVALLERGLKVTALEIDERMRAHLTEKFAAQIAAGRLVVIAADATNFDWPAWEKTSGGARVICGNLPYNVGTPILFSALENARVAKAFCFMLQKEVVQRLCSDSGSKEYGVPSILLNLSCHVLDKFWVNPGSFNPPPKVDSGVMTYVRREDVDPKIDPLNAHEGFETFSARLRKGFQTRRKMLRKAFPKLDPESGAKRPEDLEPETWLRLWKEGLLE
ncbi:MAG: 16S rRNA (adenine(1518)-N(6)/adenine(1519)-N(6))-dimethyltransferase RsmA [Bdellovibrionota bacterium]